MFERFFPDGWAASAYAVDYETLYAKGYRGLIYDIDNTLVPHGAPADEEAIAHFARLRALGFSTCLISNNQADRVAPFADAVGSIYVANAHKPAPEKYLEACAEMGTEPGETCFLGDQIFTDIWGARRAGIHAVLVMPIHPREEIQIICKRQLERPVLAAYRRAQKKRGEKVLPAQRFQRPGRVQIAGRITDPAAAEERGSDTSAQK